MNVARGLRRTPNWAVTAVSLTLAVMLGVGCAGDGGESSEPEHEGAPVGLPVTPPPVAAVVITPSLGWAAHSHGGPAAQIDHASFTLENRTDQVAHVEVQKVEFVTGHDCKDFPGDIQSTPPAKGIALAGRGVRAAVDLPPGASEQARVEIVPVQAAYGHCDRFALRVYFLVDGTVRIAVAETKVEREADMSDTLD